MDGTIIYRDESTEIRRLKDSEFDYKELEKWYKNPEVYEYFEQRILTYEEIIKKYYPRTKEECNIKVFIIEQYNKPIGLIQYYKDKVEKIDTLGNHVEETLLIIQKDNYIDI